MVKEVIINPEHIAVKIHFVQTGQTIRMPSGKLLEIVENYIKTLEAGAFVFDVNKKS